MNWRIFLVYIQTCWKLLKEDNLLCYYSTFHLVLAGQCHLENLLCDTSLLHDMNESWYKFQCFYVTCSQTLLHSSVVSGSNLTILFTASKKQLPSACTETRFKSVLAKSLSNCDKCDFFTYALTVCSFVLNLLAFSVLCNSGLYVFCLFDFRLWSFSFNFSDKTVLCFLGNLAECLIFVGAFFHTLSLFKRGFFFGIRVSVHHLYLMMYHLSWKDSKFYLHHCHLFHFLPNPSQ